MNYKEIIRYDKNGQQIQPHDRVMVDFCDLPNYVVQMDVDIILPVNRLIAHPFMPNKVLVSNPELIIFRSKTHLMKIKVTQVLCRMFGEGISQIVDCDDCEIVPDDELALMKLKAEKYSEPNIYDPRHSTYSINYIDESQK